MSEYLSFRKMITPVFIQVIFWIAIAGIVIAALVQMANDAVAAGLLTLIFGPLFARIYAEILMVIFRINDNVAAIRQGKAGGAAENVLT
jgi:hypothetical protein